MDRKPEWQNVLSQLIVIFKNSCIELSFHIYCVSQYTVKQPESHPSYQRWQWLNHNLFIISIIPKCISQTVCTSSCGWMDRCGPAGTNGHCPMVWNLILCRPIWLVTAFLDKGWFIPSGVQGKKRSQGSKCLSEYPVFRTWAIAY